MKIKILYMVEEIKVMIIDSNTVIIGKESGKMISGYLNDISFYENDIILSHWIKDLSREENKIDNLYPINQDVIVIDIKKRIILNFQDFCDIAIQNSIEFINLIENGYKSLSKENLKEKIEHYRIPFEKKKIKRIYTRKYDEVKEIPIPKSFLEYVKLLLDDVYIDIELDTSLYTTKNCKNEFEFQTYFSELKIHD
jgi:hypothetical protein